MASVTPVIGSINQEIQRRTERDQRSSNIKLKESVVSRPKSNRKLILISPPRPPPSPHKIITKEAANNNKKPGSKNPNIKESVYFNDIPISVSRFIDGTN